jgi:phosphatidylserine/phosphatidylglycerophosphate/cardiolipin synthase-like enzyme
MSRRGQATQPLWAGLVTLLLLLAAIVVVLLLFESSGPTETAPAPGGPATTSDLWEVGFTAPLIPDDPSKHHGGIDERLVALMDRATRTMDVAVYDFDLGNVADAMARATRRGVRVRMVTDSDTVNNTRDAKVQSALGRVREAGVPIVPDGRGPIMHNKFTVVDGEWVETGSWNYTDGDTYRLNNNLAIFRSRELAENYSAEFEKMFSLKKFGPNKPKGVPHPVLQIGPTRVENYYSAEDGVASRIVDQIGRAEQKIHFLAFSFTHDGIGRAILDKQAAGLQVQGVFETTGSNTRFSEYTTMKDAGLEVYQDGSPYLMHHKVILLDDRLTIFGSFNFSDGADRDNDENLLIVDDRELTARFEQEFQRVLALAKNPPARR